MMYLPTYNVYCIIPHKITKLTTRKHKYKDNILVSMYFASTKQSQV